MQKSLIMKFSEINLHDEILKAVDALGFKEATPIQEKVIPLLLEKENDIIGLAQTGTGKTAAFSLPVIQKINYNSKKTQSIILCPTRELCLQITKDIKNYTKYISKINTTAVYGGANIQTQIKSIQKGSQIIVGTPGRVIDLIKRKKLKLDFINWVVLDEADEMLNMGFKDDLDTILEYTPTQKQTLLFSATMPKEVMRISKTYMHDPEIIKVAKTNEGAKNVEHHYYMVNAKDKYKALRRICDVNPDIYGIVFCRTRRETKTIAEKLMQDGYNADALHGDLSQAQRDYVMQKFRIKNIQILVATDVAARGIDINELTHVINYNLPDENEVYIHRSGRTGRAGNKGISIIIAHSREGRKIKMIEKILKKEIIHKNIPNGEEICKIQLIKSIDKVLSADINDQINKYFPEIEEKIIDIQKEELIKRFMSLEFNKFLSFYKNANDLNISSKQLKNKFDRKTLDNNKKSKKGVAEKGYCRFFINIGSRNKIQVHNLIGLINEYTKDRNIPIGKIDIMKRFSFFEVPSNYERKILNGFKKSFWHDIALNVEISEIPKEKEKRINKNHKEKAKKLKKRSRSNKTSSFAEKFRKRKNK